jgi:hypothetical protein
MQTSSSPACALSGALLASTAFDHPFVGIFPNTLAPRELWQKTEAKRA